MLLPVSVQLILRRLVESGYSAYAVGGCVRDNLLGHVPKDWDICTSALPEEIKHVFSEERLVETGIKHGTVTLILDHTPYEITTFRSESVYSDHRHPDSVSFLSEIDGDLSRRDFTVNAMACDTEGHILDLFDGLSDLRSGIIRCVGDPDDRFHEDALRVLRGLRFASFLDFRIDERTADAIRSHYPDLRLVAAERIREELTKLLCGKGVGRILRAFPDVFSFLIPHLKPTIGFDQNNPHHLFDVWEHTVRSVEGVPPDPVLRMTMLLHDTGKPLSRSTDEKGIGHYYGHPAISADLAENTLNFLRCDKAFTERVLRLVRSHDLDIKPQRIRLLKLLNRLGEKDLRALLQIRKADRLATGTRTTDECEREYHECLAALETLLLEKPCFSLADLAVDGNDLMLLGLRGKEIGESLRLLLSDVIENKVPNEKQALIDSIKYPKK